MSRGCCVALPRGAMGLSAVLIVVFPDHTHLFFFTYGEAQPFYYCGLKRFPQKGRNCPEYGVQREISKKDDHFISVCRFSGRRQHTANHLHKRQLDEQMKHWPKKTIQKQTRVQIMHS